VVIGAPWCQHTLYMQKKSVILKKVKKLRIIAEIKDDYV
jgi:hypothetical protein